MTREEMVDLVEFIAAICPQQRIDRATAIPWYEVIGGLEFADARAAVVAVKHSQPFVDVSDIAIECARARRSGGHPSSRTPAEAITDANRRELNPAGGTPASEEFRKAKAVMDARMKARDKAAYMRDPATDAAAREAADRKDPQ